MRRYLLLGLLLATGVAGAQGKRSEALVTLDGYFPFVPPETAEAWTARRAVVQRRVLVAAGLWPVARMVEPKLVRWGAIEREGYRVERVYFESLPGFHVTGSLYVPAEGKGPFPGVLAPHGHWASGRFSTISDAEASGQMERGEEQYLANAKFHLQARCAQLARMGCVVLHYDMIGYADSRQIEHRSGFGDVQAELWSLGAFGLQTRNSLQALGVLQGLPEVDPTRVAVTGGSGGGTQTFILGAVDDRPSVLFPAVMASTAMQGGCVCENASHLRVDTGNIELAAMAAPRPLGLTGADDWTKEILSKGLPELRALYSMLGHEQRVQAWCYPTFPHNYNAISRGHLYGFLNEHLGLGQDLPIVEPLLVPIAISQLSVYDEDHARPTGGIEEVRAAMLGLAREDLQRLAELAASDPGAYRRIVGGALEVMLHMPEGPAIKGAAHVDVLGAGALTPALLEALGSEASIEKHEPFAGSLRTDHRNGQVLYTWGYNPTHLAYRVHDLRARLAGAPNGARPALLGQGGQARAALLAAALDPQSVSRIAVDFSAGFDAISEHADPDFLPGAERWGGLAGYAALIAPTPLALLGVQEVPEIVRAAYGAAGASDAVRAMLDPTQAELASWLLESMHNEIKPLPSVQVLWSVIRQLVTGRHILGRQSGLLVVAPLTGTTQGFLSRGQISGELGAEQLSQIDYLLPALRESNQERQSITLDEPIAGVFLGTSKLPLLDYLRASRQYWRTEADGPIDEAWERDLLRARGWVKFWAPAVSQDGNAALVRFIFGPSAHAAAGTCFLIKDASGVWQVQWTDTARFF